MARPPFTTLLPALLLGVLALGACSAPQEPRVFVQPPAAVAMDMETARRIAASIPPAAPGGEAALRAMFSGPSRASATALPDATRNTDHSVTQGHRGARTIFSPGPRMDAPSIMAQQRLQGVEDGNHRYNTDAPVLGLFDAGLDGDTRDVSPLDIIGGLVGGGILRNAGVLGGGGFAIPLSR